MKKITIYYHFKYKVLYELKKEYKIRWKNWLIYKYI